MFSRQLTERIRISLSVPQYAEEIFALTERNRAFLRQWLPWLDKTMAIEDTRSFLNSQLHGFAAGECLHVTIFHDNVLVGVAGFNLIDHTHGIAYIGYWLGEEFNGHGIMTAVVRELIMIGREFYPLQKIEIRCATGNSRSRAIPERLGFTHEGTLRCAERVYYKLYDHEVYGLLLNPQAHLAGAIIEASERGHEGF